MNIHGRAALIAALAVLAVLAVQQFLYSLVNYGSGFGSAVLTPVAPGMFGFSALPDYYFQPSIDGLLFSLLPFAAGVFVSCWLFLPITRTLDLRTAAIRAVIASAFGGLAVLIVQTVVAVIEFAVGTAIGATRGPLIVDVIHAAASGLNSAIYGVPAVLLAGLALWTWLKARPSD